MGSAILSFLFIELRYFISIYHLALFYSYGDHLGHFIIKPFSYKSFLSAYVLRTRGCLNLSF